MSAPITRKRLKDWAGEQVVHEAESIVERGLVIDATYEDPFIKGTILWNNRDLLTSLKILPDGNVENRCPCYANVERGIICPHVIALGVSLVRRATDPLRDAKHEEELRRAKRLAAIDESAYLKRVETDAPGALPCRLVLTLAHDWQDFVTGDSIPMRCEARYQDEVMPLDAIPTSLPLSFSKQDDALLFVLEDISEGPAKGELVLNRADFINIIRLYSGRELQVENGEPITINEATVTSTVRMDLDRENGELLLFAHTELPFLESTEFPSYIVSGKQGWVYGASNLWSLENLLPLPYHGIYTDPVVIKRPDVLRFYRHELPTLEQHARIETDITLDLFTIDPAQPGFHLVISGSAASVSAILYATYGDNELIAGKRDSRGDFAAPDPEDLMRYLVRNAARETDALQRLSQYGMTGEHGKDLSSIVEKRNVLNFLGRAIPALRRHGWKVELQGRVAPILEETGFVTPVVQVQDTGGHGWFDVGFDFEAPGGTSLSPNEIQRAIRMGEAFVSHQGKTLLIDTEAIESMQDVFSDCASADADQPGYFRMSDIYAPFVKSSLDSLDGIDVEENPAWRQRAQTVNRTTELKPIDLGPKLNDTLRSYQKTGVSWLRFLEESGFAGILADEMGLGKTVQTLAWLKLERLHEAARNKPALIVCPTSIVENWAMEAHKFVPGLDVRVMSGSERHEHWENLDQADLAVTSYALLRRDLDHYLNHEFSAAILDEAQHIKNRSTQNALAAKQIRARHKLVLTGTPIENSVSDLWSIMDFLMPGYMGAHDTFRSNYALPIASGGPVAAAAQTKLRRKMHPFLLRRLKREVARDLPPRINKISPCTLTGDQKLVYTELLETSRRRIKNMVAEKGFNRSRMEILTTLMRLRQACCHLDLLKIDGLNAKHPSAKMELFFELLDEAMDGGHRVLVFSQFVSMLTILRKEFEERSIDYCYLDGSTKERMKVVQQFNTQREIPVFLISLKAGGTGLNLTGADMVIHFDPWWNPAVENQATDRAYRIGQKRTVYSIKLITKGTVEEKVLEMQKQKQAIFDATIENDEAVLQKLSWDDVQDLLSL
jgi:superfamily II DNA or RNA helicase